MEPFDLGLYRLSKYINRRKMTRVRREKSLDAKLNLYPVVGKRWTDSGPRVCPTFILDMLMRLIILADSCETVRCYDGRVCRMKDGVPECLCKPHCETRMKELGPVCGTDGRRYKNYCSLLRRNCMYHQHEQIAYLGKCKSKYSIGPKITMSP